MAFKRMMTLGAVVAALAFTGCQDRTRQDVGTGAPGDQTQPATGGSGNVDSTIPGSSDTIGGTPQDARPGTELGGTGDLGEGGSGSMNQQDDTGSMDHGGTGGSGTVHQPGTGDSLDQSGTGGAGDDLGTSGDLDQNLDQRNQLDDPESVRGSDTEAR
jgi:hypothetical protein